MMMTKKTEKYLYPGILIAMCLLTYRCIREIKLDISNDSSSDSGVSDDAGSDDTDETDTGDSDADDDDSSTETENDADSGGADSDEPDGGVSGIVAASLDMLCLKLGPMSEPR